MTSSRSNPEPPPDPRGSSGGRGARRARSSASPASPTFRALTTAECLALLARHDVGRIAYSLHGRVGLEPINYAYEDGWLYGRTSYGTKLETLLHHPWVAFEVDEAEGTFDWRSVVVTGTFYRVTAEGSVAQRDSWQRAIRLLGEIVPGTMTPNDPVPFRDIVFHIHVDEITGRAASSAPAASEPPDDDDGSTAASPTPARG